MEGVEWSHLAQARKYWLVFMNTVISLRVRQNERSFLTA